VADDPIGLIPPMHGRLGKGLIDLGSPLFLGYVLEYGRSYSPKVASVKIAESFPDGGSNVDSAPICDGAFMIINRQRNADSIAVIIKGRNGQQLDTVQVDLRIQY
jgi:hypothetical protein